MDDSLIKQLPVTVSVVQDAVLCSYTTFQLGGGCPALLMCPDADALVESARLLIEAELPYLVIGQGSNLLVSDSGIPEVVLRYCAEDAARIECNGERVVVSGDTLLDDLARVCVEMGLGDVTFCSGIPGTVGGAILGNAGAFGRQIGDVVESVALMDVDGSVRSVQADELGFQYRHSALKESGGVVLSATLQLEKMEEGPMQQEREEILALRRDKHPNWRETPCAGSIFRNVEPSSAAERRKAAGWFLEQAGVKDFRVGGAYLFSKHANIIVTDPTATAQDVYALTEKMMAAVEEQFGFSLYREIRLLGAFIPCQRS